MNGINLSEVKIKMLFELFVFFEIVMIGFFVGAFFSKQEILWGVTALFSGVLMFTSFNIEYYVYIWNSTVGAYVPTITYFSYPYLMGINLAFFVLTLVLGLFDIFDKYGGRFVGEKEE